MENEKHKFLEDRIFEVNMSEQRVLLLVEEKAEKTKSGIIIPDSAEDDKPRICTVMRVGKGDEGTPMQYCVGQTVLLSKFSGKEIDFHLKGHGFATFLVTNQIDIMCTLKEE